MSSPPGHQSIQSVEGTPAFRREVDLNRTIYGYSSEKEMEEEQQIVTPVVPSPKKNEGPSEKRMLGFNIQKSPSQKQQDYIDELRRTIIRQGKTISDLEFDKDYLEGQLERKNEKIKEMEQAEREYEEMEENDKAGMKAELKMLKKILEEKQSEVLDLKDVLDSKENEIENLRKELAKTFKSTGEAPPLFSAYSKQIEEEVTNRKPSVFNMKNELNRTKEELNFANQQISMIIETNEVEKAELVSRHEEEKKGMEEKIEDLNKTIQLMSQW